MGPRADPVRLVRRTLARLATGPAVHRYDPATGDEVNRDGLRGREGAFLPVTFMAVAALAAVGLRDEAHARLDELCRTLPRLLPEMSDPVEGRGLGNVPLVWSHMELTRALYLLTSPTGAPGGGRSKSPAGASPATACCVPPAGRRSQPSRP